MPGDELDHGRAAVSVMWRVRCRLDEMEQGVRHRAAPRICCDPTNVRAPAQLSI